jgi:hypothetical protein
MFRAGGHADAIAAALGPNRTVRKSYEHALAQAHTVAARAVDSGQTSIAAASGRSVTILLACLLAALVIGLGVAVWVVRTILRPVYALLTIFADPELRSIG